MAKGPKSSFYAVQKGTRPGVYMTWDACEAQVKGFNGAKFKKFSTLADAEAFVTSPGLESRSALPAVGITSPGGSRIASPVVPKTAIETDEVGWDVVYSDGACKGNGKIGSVAGIGVWWGRDDSRNLSERCPGEQTNNRAELIAIIRVLETTPAGERPLVVKTDSKYSIQCVEEWIHNWEMNGWRSASGAPVKNKSVIQYLSSLINLRLKAGQQLRLKYVQGHVGIEGNEAADNLANQGTLLPAVPERNWGGLTEALEEDRKVQDKVAVASEVPFDFVIGEGDLLTPDQLKEMGRTQNFDLY